MNDHDDIVATAGPDMPEVLDAETLDTFSAGAYGGSNSCEPYAGDNTCEPPRSGHASFQDLTIKPSPQKSQRAGRTNAGFTSR